MKKAITATIAVITTIMGFAFGAMVTTPPGIQIDGLATNNNVMVYQDGLLKDSGVAPTNLVSVTNLSASIAALEAQTNTWNAGGSVDTDTLVAATNGTALNLSVVDGSYSGVFSRWPNGVPAINRNFLDDYTTVDESTSGSASVATLDNTHKRISVASGNSGKWGYSSKAIVNNIACQISGSGGLWSDINSAHFLYTIGGFGEFYADGDSSTNTTARFAITEKGESVTSLALDRRGVGFLATNNTAYGIFCSDNATETVFGSGYDLPDSGQRFYIDLFVSNGLFEVYYSGDLVASTNLSGFRVIPYYFMNYSVTNASALNLLDIYGYYFEYLDD
jgi:hypothetical protein